MRSYVELMRLSNLPTVVTNVLVGLCAGYMAAASPHVLPDAAPPEPQVLWQLLMTQRGLLVVLAVGCFYAMGMVLNDVSDRELDRIERPDRPLPAGRITVRAAVVLAIVLTLLGMMLLALLPQPHTFAWGAVLVTAIAVYNVLHQRFVGSIVVMGLCRALVYFVAASISTAVHEPAWWMLVLIFALIPGVYTAALTLMARLENERLIGRRRWAAAAMPVIVLSAVVFVTPRGINILWAGVAAVALLVWLARGAACVFAQPPRSKQAVLTWLSGICLMDAWFLTLMSRPITALVAGACFALTVCAHKRIMGT
jgi:4-hydroxybenzoate polyprenyltransferase